MMDVQGCNAKHLLYYPQETAMSDTHIASSAFRQAHLRSERLRRLIALGASGVAFLMRSVRVLIHSGGENTPLWLTTLGVLAPFAAYEFLMLLEVNHAYEQQRESQTH
jgi:hypothetical protein